MKHLHGLLSWRERVNALAGTRSLERWIWLLFAVGIVAQATIAMTATKPPFHDEPWYLNNVGYIHKYGLGVEFLKQFPGYAGPLHAYIHYFLEPLTELRVPWVRLVSVFFSAGSVLAMAGALRAMGVVNAVSHAVGMLAVPMNWVIATTALTEMNAIFFLCGACWLLAESLREGRGMGGAIGFGLTAGICLSLAIMGRQMSFAFIVAPVILVAFKPTRVAGLAFLLGCVPALWVIAGIWGSFVPTGIWKDYYESAQWGVRKQFEIRHGLLAGGYAAVVAAILAPSWLKFHARRAVAILGACLAANALLLKDSWVPMRSIIGGLLPASFMAPVGGLVVAAFYAVGIYFYVHLLELAWQKRREPFMLGLTLATGAILATTIRVTHLFSARYTLMAMPVLLMVVWTHSPLSVFKVVRFGLAFLLGAVLSVNNLHGPDTENNWGGRGPVFYRHLKPVNRTSVPEEYLVPSGESAR